MKILFLPIDIDMTDLDFSQIDLSQRFDSYSQLFWNTSFVNDTIIKKNNFDKILNQLPFVKITSLLYKVQLREVHQHIDVYPHMKFENGELDHIKSNEPAGYRMVLKGNNDRLFVSNSTNWDCTKTPHTPREECEWINAKLPHTPCCYLINSTQTVHKVLDDVDRRTIYIRGFLDPERHRRLINRSYEKYRDYAIIAK